MIDNQSDDNFGVKLNSLESTTKKLSLNVNKNENESQESGSHESDNYLQISLPDKVFLYDLTFECPKECFSCFEVDFFTDPRNFIDLGLARIWF